MAKFELNEFGEVDIDDVDLNEVDFTVKQELAKKLTIMFLDCSYKDQVEIFQEYILDAWCHEGWGNETFHRDVAQLLSDAESTESVQEVLKPKL
jgi:hypothetical protein